MTCNCKANHIYHDGSYVCSGCGRNKTLEHLNQLGYDFNTDLKDYVNKDGCLIHKWKSYEGFKEKYNYCEVCGQKE